MLDFISHLMYDSGLNKSNGSSRIIANATNAQSYQIMIGVRKSDNDPGRQYAAT
jgi:hypothetical protein